MHGWIEADSNRIAHTGVCINTELWNYVIILLVHGDFAEQSDQVTNLSSALCLSNIHWLYYHDILLPDNRPGPSMYMNYYKVKELHLSGLITHLVLLYLCYLSPTFASTVKRQRWTALDISRLGIYH